MTQSFCLSFFCVDVLPKNEDAASSRSKPAVAPGWLSRSKPGKNPSDSFGKSLISGERKSDFSPKPLILKDDFEYHSFERAYSRGIDSRRFMGAPLILQGFGTVCVGGIGVHPNLQREKPDSAGLLLFSLFLFYRIEQIEYANYFVG